MAERTRLLRATVFAAFTMLIVACGFCAQQAWAVTPDEGKEYNSTDSTTFADDASKVTITKVLQANQTVVTTGWEFTFHFEPQGGTGTTVDDTPVIENKKVTAAAMTNTSVDSEHSWNSTHTEQYILLSGFIPSTGTDATSTFTHAGEYVYRVTEVAGNQAGVHYSQAAYLMRVYVVNDDTAANGLKISTVTVDKLLNDDGTTHDATTAQDGYKVDPQPKKRDGDDGGNYSGFAFVNRYEAVNQLVISKEVSGAAADKTRAFDFKATISAPTNTVIAAEGVQAFTYTGETKGDAVAFTVSADKKTLTLGTAASAGVDTTFSLKHGQRVVITGLPVGASFVVTEVGTAGYTPSAVVVHDGVNVSPTAVSAGAALTVDEKVKGRPPTLEQGRPDVSLNEISNTGDSAVTFTNTLESITPTGIIISYLPYILLIGIPVMAFVAWFVVRRRRSASER